MRTSARDYKTPAEWEREYGIVVWDDDGWRKDGKSFLDPISQEEWEERMNDSTIGRLNRLSSS